MTIRTGMKLGPYEITALIGKGGMGEVYRAHDTKLKRDVAIKILPEEFSRNADRVSRFQREAEVLASLNDPNIADIHSVEEADGSQFLVLELVEGETLADRIKRGPLPVEEALAIAKGICEALEAAHDKGVVHRDLKPANVKITPQGNVKVLDFGLAKVREVQSEMSTLSNSPTLLSGSMPGVILGTASYMSPEQAKGKAVDRRTDIFAFGCVLYEMLAGKQAFYGEDATEIISRVLQQDPDWTLLPGNLSPRVQELLQLCLEKDLRKRRSDAADVRIDIDQALSARAGIAGLPADRLPLRNPLMWGAVVVFLIVSVLVSILTIRHIREAPLAEMRVEITTLPTSDPMSFALSADGRQIVFVASGNGEPRLWLRPLDKTTAQPLGGTEGASFPFWSPDSRSIGFFANGKLKRIDIAGGSPQILSDAFNNGGAWSPDGVILFARILGGPLFRIPASGGEPVAITKLYKQTGHSFPHFLLDGRQFA